MSSDCFSSNSNGRAGDSDSPLNSSNGFDARSRSRAENSDILLTSSTAQEGSTEITRTPISLSSKEETVQTRIVEDSSLNNNSATLVNTDGSTHKNFSHALSDNRLVPGDIRFGSDANEASTTMTFPVCESIDVMNAVDPLGGDWHEVPLSRAENGMPTEIDNQEDDATVISSSANIDSEPMVDDLGMLQPGSKFGQFTILRYIGGGGMGRVYEGEDRDLERKVAIKVLPERRARDGGVVARFLNEAKSAARLNHENIAQVYLSGNVNGIPYIAFEFVEGVNLRDYVIENGVLNLNEAIGYVLQIAAALAHAASHGVTHRDVKPSNIIVTPQKRVKLIDMGLARLLKPKFDDDLTESGVTLGTFDYISPEQARDPRAADVRSDVYSLGCTFYYMLVGAPPFPEGTVLQKLLQHQGDEAPDVREANPSIPVEIAVVVKKMMKKEPNERYQTPEVLIADLVSIAKLLGLNLSNRDFDESNLPEETDARATVRRLPGVFAVLFFTLLIGGYSFFSKPQDVALPEIVTPITTGGTASVEADESVAVKNDVRESVFDAAAGIYDISSLTGEDSVSDALWNSSLTQQVDKNVLMEPSTLDSLYARGSAPLNSRIPVALVDDTYEWRRSYLAAGDSVSASKRIALGWRGTGVDKAVEAVSFSKYGDWAEDETTSRSFVAYSTLGANVDSSTAGTPASTSVRIVDRVGKASNSFVSIQAALAAGLPRESKEPLRIELKFNDALSTPPLSLVNQKVEIYSSEGYYPTLRFEPTESTSGVGTSMFWLNGSEVVVHGVSVDFTVPSQDAFSAEEWSVFEGVGASSLTLRDSSLTVCNMSGDVYSSPLHSNVAFCRSRADIPYGESLEGDIGTNFTVRLENVLARGEANLFVADRGAKLEVKNSVINVSGAVLAYAENKRVTSEKQAPFTLSLDQSIIIGRSPLLRVDVDNSANLTSLWDVSFLNSIIRLNEQPLVLLQTSTNFDEAPLLARCRIEGMLALDVACFCRKRSGRGEPYQDEALGGEVNVCEEAKLTDLNSEAAGRLESIPPHRFSLVDFMTYVVSPVRTSLTLSSLMKTNAENIKNGFVGARVERVF